MNFSLRNEEQPLEEKFKVIMEELPEIPDDIPEKYKQKIRHTTHKAMFYAGVISASHSSPDENPEAIADKNLEAMTEEIMQLLFESLAGSLAEAFANKASQE